MQYRHALDHPASAINIGVMDDVAYVAQNPAVLDQLKATSAHTRPTATELLQDEWVTERSERPVGWYSKEKWQKMMQQRHENEQGSAAS